jgi:hypothetical protein
MIAKPQPTRDTKTLSQAFIIFHFYKENHCFSQHPIPAVYFFPAFLLFLAKIDQD